MPMPNLMARPLGDELGCAGRLDLILCRQDAQYLGQPRRPCALDHCRAILDKRVVRQMTVRIDHTD